MMVHQKTKTFLVKFTLFCLLSFVNNAVSQIDLQYQDRGDRYEGIKPRPVSDYDIELISAIMNYQEKVTQVPEYFKIKFFLDHISEVHLTVRELDYKHFYWMDKIKPSKTWRPGFNNMFTWPTRDVIQQLKGIELYDLGVVARLNREIPSKVEQVAPVIFYHNQFPPVINGYLFTFKTNEDARLTCSIYKEGVAKPVFTSIFQRQRGGRPFTVRWDCKEAAEGSYKLVINGYFLDTNNPIDQTVRFIHHQRVTE